MIDHYGGACNVNAGQLCSSNFICEEGKCLCPYEDHQIYDKKQKTCISLVKGPCNNGSASGCVKNAHCVMTEEGVSECRCKHGFIPVDRECELTFGQACSVRSQRRSIRLFIIDGSKALGAHSGELRSGEIFDNSDDEPRCDRLAPLKCVHGTCQCGGFQFYDYELQKCRGSVGSRCDPADKEFCTEGAICEAYRGLASVNETAAATESGTVRARNKRYGRCKCKSGYVTETNRSCSRVIL